MVLLRHNMAWNLNFVDLRKIDGVTAVVYNGKPQTPEVVVDETWFSDPNLCRKTKVELLDPALKGTFIVLNACAKVPSIKRVVLTSSIAAVVYNGKPQTPEVVVDETWFSDPNLCRKTKDQDDGLDLIENEDQVDIENHAHIRENI
ncbi:cinnamoyl-CoA reductase 1 [Spinacia oleracea]|uniref:Cinnamoyl-CoA reductase 1 n=1 Tax=Spinacia oleracea TaxID=3562 RepID=A0A9R0ILN8_SPIOL|nr:cinnamoyl-CoA reductase 1-like [Spinacia oleracea]